jgi:hypothetical protein
MRAKECKTCIFAEKVLFIEALMDAGYFGYCHRYPPFRKVDSMGNFEGYNYIFNGEWCGEWRAKTIEKKLRRTTAAVCNTAGH